jgi:prephenate dehydratase
VTRASIQGEAGAFSHTAARQLFGDDVEIVPCTSFDDLFESVVRGRATHGVVPVENTLAGSVPGNLDRLMDSGLHAVSETNVRVELCLIAPPNRQVSDLRSAASHPVALEQCRRFFRERPQVTPVTIYDTAGGVRDLMRGGANFDAAIASRLAAGLYGANVLLEGIEDNHKNFTRFFAVATEPGEPPAESVTASLGFVVPHEPGSLHRALGHFARAGVNLTRLESRPIPGRPWEYRFYADVHGDRDPIEEALEALGRGAADVHVLGIYGRPSTSN